MKFITYESFRELAQMVWKLGELEFDWNHCGSLPIEQNVVKRAIRLLHALREREVLIFDEEGPTFNELTQEDIEKCYDEAKKHNGTEDYWKFLNRLTPTIDYNCLTISSTIRGGIEFAGTCYNALVSVEILPGDTDLMYYEHGYIDEEITPPVYRQMEAEETSNYELVASIIKRNISHCF